jgi:hypothetical protein
MPGQVKLEVKKDEKPEENPNLIIWNKVCRPPKEALKQIKGGRLTGMTDVNPQWRIKAMTEQFGLIGFGWKYDIVEKWNETLDGQVACFVKIALYYKVDDNWSEPVIGIGGSMLLTRETKGLYLSDEGYKMALTDAISVAVKHIGIAADIYAGLWDGWKYKDEPEKPKPPEFTKEEQAAINEVHKRLFDIASEKGLMPDNASIKNFAMNSRAKRLPVTPEEIAKFVDFLVEANTPEKDRKNYLGQVCKPMPKQPNNEP